MVFQIMTDNKDHPRSCSGGYAKCSIVQQDDNDVCADTSIQGHHENDGSKDGKNEILDIYLTLASTYNFVPTEPTFEEVKSSKAD